MERNQALAHEVIRDDSLGKLNERGFAAWQEKAVAPSAALCEAILSLVVEQDCCPGFVNQQQDLTSPELLHIANSILFSLH